MTTPPRDPASETLAPADLIRIEHLCDRYEDQLKAGSAADLAEYLTQVPAVARPVLIRELLRLVLVYRGADDPASICRDYRTRFPELANAIDGVFRQELRGSSVEPDLPEWLRAGGEPLPGFVLQQRLGRGGFGQVWAAAAPGGIRVALKFVDLAADGRVEKTALAIVRHLRHPNLVVVFGAWERDGWLLIGMEVADDSLANRLSEARRAGLHGLPRGELKRYLAETAGALDYLSKPRHVLDGGKPMALQHGDIKPQNVLLLGRHVKLADFGLVRVLGRDRTGHGLTPAYAAPEVFRGEPSRWSDQYALAVAYCELRGGRRPFDRNTPVEFAAAHASDSPDLGMLPEPERPIVARALAKSPRDRWPTCRQFVRELVRVQQTLEPEEVPIKLRLQRVRGEPPAFVPPAQPTGRAEEDLSDQSITRSGLLTQSPRQAPPGRAASRWHFSSHRSNPEHPKRGNWLVGLTGLCAAACVTALTVSLFTSESTGVLGWVVRTRIPLIVLAALCGLVTVYLLITRSFRVRKGGEKQHHPDDPDRKADGEASKATPTGPTFDPTTFLDDVIRQTDNRPPIPPLELAAYISPMSTSVDTFDPEQPAGGLAIHGFDRLDGHTEAVWAVGLSADARTAVSASLDGTIRVWDVAARRETQILAGHSGEVTCVTMSPDGRRVVSGSADGTIQCWDATTGAPLWSWNDSGGSIAAVAIAGPSVIVGRTDGSVCGRSLSVGRLGMTYANFGGQIASIALSPNKRTAVVGGADGRLCEYDLDGDRIVWSHHNPQLGTIHAVAYSSDGSLLAAGTESGQILVRNAPLNAPAPFRGHSDWIRGLAFDGATLLSVGDDEAIRTWKSGAGHWIPADVCRSADESLLAAACAAGVTVVGGESGSLHVRPARTGSSDDSTAGR